MFGEDSGDGPVTFFEDLFKMADNRGSVGAPKWTGPAPGYEVDQQGQSVPDQQITAFVDIFPAFLATVPGGLIPWAGDICCATIADCGTAQDCIGGNCQQIP